MSSYVIYKTQCPECAKLGMDTSRDNLAVYNDNHHYCFRCGYYWNDIRSSIQNIGKQSVVSIRETISLPNDVSIDYPQIALDWIVSYELTIDDLHNHNVLWSNEGIYTKTYGQVKDLLIFPVWQSDQLVLLTGRYFGTDIKPKWLMKGDNKNVIHLINPHANSIVIVEDIISGIKISKLGKDYGALVLFNSHNPIHKLKQLGRKYKYYLWLDNDKARDSIFFTREAVGHGLYIKSIFSDRDPKDESLNYIRKKLT